MKNYIKMKRIPTISIFVFFFLTFTLTGQRATENDPGEIQLKNGTINGVTLDGGFTFLNTPYSGSIKLNDGYGTTRIKMFGGKEFVNPNTTEKVPLVQLSGTVEGNASETFMKFINDSYNDSWNFNLSGEGLSGSYFNFVYKFGAVNTAVATLTSSGWLGSSDRRLKTNINTINSALPSLMKLNPTNYNRKINLGQEEYGFIAQEVEKIYPDMVSVIPTEDGEGQYMMNYTQLIPILTKGMQEQQEIIDNQNALILDLQKRMEALEKAN